MQCQRSLWKPITWVRRARAQGIFRGIVHTGEVARRIRRRCEAPTALSKMLAFFTLAQAASAPPPPILEATDFSAPAFIAPAFLTNGHIGVRPGPIPLVANPYAGAARPLDPDGKPSFDPTVPAVVAGFMHRDSGRQTVLAPAPYPFSTIVRLDGRVLIGEVWGGAAERAQPPLLRQQLRHLRHKRRR